MRAISRSDPPRRYVALGDSFTAGAPEAIGPSFADCLADLLRAANPRLSYWNLAAAGARTTDVATRQLAPALALAPDAVTVVCGANDVLLSVRPDVDGHAAGIERTLSALRAAVPQARIVTASLPDPSRMLGLRARSAARVGRALAAINDATRSSARRHGAALIELADHPAATLRGNYADDGYHPSPDASRRTAAAFAQIFGITSRRQEASL